MSITKHTTLDQIEVRNGGIVQVRLAKEVRDGGVLLHREWHRTAFMPDTDIDSQFAEVNRHLTNLLGFPSVSGDVVDTVKAHAAIARGANS